MCIDCNVEYCIAQIILHTRGPRVYEGFMNIHDSLYLASHHKIMDP